MELVDREHPENSLLFQKPTARIPHTGGERIPKNSPEEAILKTWVEHLAKLSGAELESAQRYKQEEEAGYGVVQTAVLRRLTNSQYNNTVRDLLGNMLSPANSFPPEDFVNGFKNQYQALPVSPLLTEAYGGTAEKLAADAFRRGDFHELIPCKPVSDNDAGCRASFIKSFGRRAFRRPLDPEEVARYTTIFRTEKTFLKGAQAVVEAMLQSPNFIFWHGPNAQSRVEGLRSRFLPFLFALEYNTRHPPFGCGGGRRSRVACRCRAHGAPHAR